MAKDRWMTNPAIEKRDALTKLHIISHLNWQREGYQTFERQRAELLDILARLTAYMQSPDGDAPPLKHFLPAGETIILEDIAAVRANMVALMAIYNAGGRLSVGPWYIQPDTTLVSGEALVRNLLLGRVDVLRHGMKLLSVAYLSGSGHHSAQLPQILNGFGIDAALVTLPAPAAPLPFRWIAPDESEILVVTYSQGSTVAQALSQQRSGGPDGPFLWLNDCDRTGQIVPDVTGQVDVPVLQSTLTDYIKALRQSFPDGMRPAIHGEMHLHNGETPNGHFSARMPLKQTGMRLQNRLIYHTERLLAVALTHGKAAYPDNLRALLEYAWRRLLVNQALPLIGGQCSDAVYDEMQVRYRQVEDVAARLIEKSLTALPGEPLIAPSSVTDVEEIGLVVWNPHSQPVRQVVEAQLILTAGRQPDVLLSPAGEEIAYSLDGHKLTFLARSPAVGYSVYTLRLSSRPVQQYRLKQVFNGSVIGSINGELLSIQDGQVNWEHQGQKMLDVLNFYSGGDAGDTTQYRPPVSDVVLRAGMADLVEIEATALYERLIFRHRMRLPPGLNEGRRERGVRLLELITTATCYESTPGIYFRTTYTNTAGDHRLRAHIRTGIHAGQLLVDAPFALLKRPLAQEGASALQAMQSVCAVADETGMLALLTRGLPEFEPMNLDGQLTLGVTLLRAVGWLDPTRTQPVPGAQHQHDMTADFRLLRLSASDLPRLLREAQTYRAPLSVFQYSQKPDAMERSYLAIDDDRIVLTALKPPQEGSGWIVRLMNPLESEISATLTVHGKLARVRRVSMAEVSQAELETSGSQVQVTLAPSQIVTLHLLFEEG